MTKEMTNEKFEQILASCKNSDDPAYILARAKEVASTGNYYYICDFAEYVQNAKLTKKVMSVLEAAIIVSNKLIAIYEFMFEMTDFGIDNFNLELFEDLIIKSKNPKLMYYSVIFVKGANVPKMLKALYETGNKKYILLVKEKYEESFNKEQCSEHTIFDASYEAALKRANDHLFLPNWLKRYVGLDYETISNKIIDSKDPYSIIELADYYEYLIDYEFADEVSLIPEIKKLNIAIREYGDVLHRYEYAWSINRSDRVKIQADIIASKKTKFMYYFREIPGVDKAKLDAAINNSGDIKYGDKISNRRRLYDEKVSRLDSYPVHFQPSHIEQVARMIKDKLSGNEELYLFTNCICNVEIDGVFVARQYDNLIYSKEGDVALLLSRELDPQKLVDILAHYNIPFINVVGRLPIDDDFVDDGDIPGFYPVRDLVVLKEAAEEALSKGINKADVYVNTPWKIRLGYRHRNCENIVVYEINGIGVVDTGKNCSLIINNGSSNNISPINLEATVASLGLIPTVIESGHPSYVKEDKSLQYKL